MCLYTSNKDGFIAEEDIIVYKYLKRNKLDKFETPYQKTPVTLGSLLVPNKNTPEISKTGVNYEINGGVIHSYTSPDYDYSFESIIKKGTKFWVNDYLTEIASESLFITPQRVLRDEETNLSSLYKYTLNVLLKNGNKVSLEDNPERKDIIGMVVSEKYIIGLDIISSYFNNTSYESERYFEEQEIRLDYDGLQNTKKIINSDIIKKITSRNISSIYRRTKRNYDQKFIFYKSYKTSFRPRFNTKRRLVLVKQHEK